MVQKSGDHHLGCIKPVVNSEIFTISTGDPRISEPSTVSEMILSMAQNWIPPTIPQEFFAGTPWFLFRCFANVGSPPIVDHCSQLKIRGCVHLGFGYFFHGNQLEQMSRMKLFQTFIGFKIEIGIKSISHIHWKTVVDCRMFFADSFCILHVYRLYTFVPFQNLQLFWMIFYRNFFAKCITEPYRTHSKSQFYNRVMKFIYLVHP